MNGPLVIRQFVVKIHSRCNLACDYCYVYTMADQRWRMRPAVMSTRTIDLAAKRIAEHIREYRPPSVGVILHGGEPLLAGPERLRYCVDQFRSRIGAGTELRFSVQTNGVRLDRAYLELFRDLGVGVGISLDGDVTAHDRHRRFAHGGGSYAAVAQALRRLGEPRYRRLFAGLLTTVDIRMSPVATFDSLLSFAPPMVDLLLPHGTWSAPPPGRKRDDLAAPYGDWLVAVFDRWYDAPIRETRVRIFEEIMNLLLGGVSRTEAVGNGRPATVVIETDGSIEDTGSLNATYSGAAGTGRHVSRDPLRLAPRQSELSVTCQGCRLRRVCGGGLYAHRYQAGTGFANPSVYCRDLQRLIDHVRERMVADVSDIRQSARVKRQPAESPAGVPAVSG